MSYNYADQRPSLFTESGQVMFLAIRDNAKRLLSLAGAFTCGQVIRGCSGDSWQMLACVDRLVELGEIREATDPAKVRGQDRVFVAVRHD